MGKEYNVFGLIDKLRLPVCSIKLLLVEKNVKQLKSLIINHHHHHHVQEGLGLIPVPCALDMKLVPPSLPRSSYVSSFFWFIL